MALWDLPIIAKTDARNTFYVLFASFITEHLSIHAGQQALLCRFL